MSERYAALYKPRKVIIQEMVRVNESTTEVVVQPKDLEKKWPPRWSEAQKEMVRNNRGFYKANPFVFLYLDPQQAQLFSVGDVCVLDSTVEHPIVVRSKAIHNPNAPRALALVCGTLKVRRGGEWRGVKAQQHDYDAQIPNHEPDVEGVKLSTAGSIPCVWTLKQAFVLLLHPYAREWKYAADFEYTYKGDDDDCYEPIVHVKLLEEVDDKTTSYMVTITLHRDSLVTRQGAVDIADTLFHELTMQEPEHPRDQPG